jgi:Fic family protein
VHIEQARQRLAQLAAAHAPWAKLEELVAGRGWPDQLVIALEQSLFGGADRAGYTNEADVSLPTASPDLRRLLDAGFLVQRGRTRSTRYVASGDLWGPRRPRTARLSNRHRRAGAGRGSHSG